MQAFVWSTNAADVLGETDGLLPAGNTGSVVLVSKGSGAAVQIPMHEIASPLASLHHDQSCGPLRGFLHRPGVRIFLSASWPFLHHFRELSRAVLDTGDVPPVVSSSSLLLILPHLRQPIKKEGGAKPSSPASIRTHCIGGFVVLPKSFDRLMNDPG